MADKKRFQQCKNLIRSKIPVEVLDDETLDNMLPEIASQMQTGRWDKFSQDYVNRTQEQIEWLEQRRLHNNNIRKTQSAEFNKWIKDGKDPEVFFNNLVAGSKTTEGRKGTLAIQIESISNRNKLFFEEMLSLEGLTRDQAVERLVDPEYFPAIMNALDKLNKRADDFDTLAPDIRAIAKAISMSQQRMLQNLKASGIDIRNRDDYLVRQTHDPGKIGRVGRKEWIEFTHTKLNKDETFKEIADPTEQAKILGKVYDEILEGEYGGVNPGNLGAGRSLHFTDSQAFSDYHNKFGEGTLYDVMTRTFRAGSKAEAAFNLLGSNPRQMLSDLEKFAEKQIQAERGGEARELFKRSQQSRHNLVNEVLGYGAHPSATIIGKAISIAKDLQLTSKLGGAVFSTVTDLPVGTANFMAKTGLNPFKAYSDVVSNWQKVLKPKERRTIGRLLGIMADEDLNRFTGEAQEKGMFGKFTGTIMRMTLLDTTTRVNRTALGAAFSNHLAANKLKGFDSLDPRLKSELEAFSISAKDWDDLRTKGIDNSVEDLELISQDALIKNGASRSLQNKYGAFMTHNSNFGAISPDARARSFLRMGIHPESTQGKALSALFLFKTFSIRAVDAIDEIVRSNPAANNASFFKALKNTDNMGILANLMFSSFAAAGVGLMARDLAFGKTPRDMTKSENLMEAMTRGVMPLWGEYTIDALSGNYDQFGRSLVKDLAGPVAGFADDTASFISSIANDIKEDKRSGKQSMNRGIRLLQQNLPGTYIPILRPILDRVFWDGLLRANNPSYDKRLQKRLQERGQQRLFE